MVNVKEDTELKTKFVQRLQERCAPINKLIQ